MRASRFELVDETQTAYKRNLKELGRQDEQWKAEQESFDTRIRDAAKNCQKLGDEKVTAYRKLRAEQDEVAK